jgi:hypothetical protein
MKNLVSLAFIGLLAIGCGASRAPSTRPVFNEAAAAAMLEPDPAPVDCIPTTCDSSQSCEQMAKGAADWAAQYGNRSNDYFNGAASVLYGRCERGYKEWAEHWKKLGK